MVKENVGSSALQPRRFMVISAVLVAMHEEDIAVSYTRSRLLLGQNNADITLPVVVDQSLPGRSFRALATVYFGTDCKETRLVKRGFQQYGNALKDVHEALGHPSHTALSIS